MSTAKFGYHAELGMCPAEGFTTTCTLVFVGQLQSISVSLKLPEL